jgi:hypothetical protein
MEEIEFRVGDLVKWWTFYADGDIVSDAGRGIVVEAIEKVHVIPHTLSENVRYDLYRVYMFQSNSDEWFPGYHLQLLSCTKD